MSKKKILLVSNTPFSVSSYGVVSKNMIASLPEYEWYVLSRQWKDPRMIFKAGDVPYMLIPSAEDDPYCFNSFLRECDRIKPDYIISIGDVGIQVVYALRIEKYWQGKKLKWFAYTPIDTDWLNKELVSNLIKINEHGTIVSMSEFGKETMKKYGVESELVYHGVDTSVFKPLPLTVRTKLRKQMGLTGKYVVFTNSNNQQRKELPNLIQGFADAKISNKFLVMHTDRLPTSSHGGIELIDYCNLLGLNKIASFTQKKQYAGWRTEWNSERLNEIYNIADVFIFNGCEGFGLPVLEAQAAGTPVLAGDVTTMPEIVPEDNLIARGSWDYATRTRYGVVDANDMAHKLKIMSKIPRSKVKLINVEKWTWVEVCKKWKKLLK